MDLIDFLKAAAISSSEHSLPDFIKNNGGGDVNVGKRYLIKKKENEDRVNKRRLFGKRLTGGERTGSVWEKDFPKM